MFPRLGRAAAGLRPLHSSAGRAAVPPAVWLLAKPLSRVAAALVGQGARRWWRRLPGHRRLELRAWANTHRRKFLTAGTCFAGGLVYAYESHIQECPVTGRKRFVALYPDQVKKISRQEFDGLLQEFSEDILPNNDKLYNRVVAVSNRLLEGNKDLRQIYDKSWTVTVVDQPVRNAFVLPSGNIFVFRGMLDLCKNDDQLGIVIGHEMAHAVLGHVAEQLTMAGFISFVLLVPMAVIWAMLPNDGVAIVTDWFVNKVVEICCHLPHSRDHEMEADEVGLRMAAKSCFDVREAPALWEIMELISEDPLESDKDLEFLSTHPVHSTRYESLSEQLTSAMKIRFDCGCARLDPNCDPQRTVKDFRKYLELQQASFQR